MNSTLDLAWVRPGPDGVCVDLSRMGFVRPVHMVSVAARAYATRRAGRTFHLIGPAAHDPGVYAARMRLGSAVQALGGTHTLPTDVHEHDRTASLLEISRIDSRDDVRRLAGLVHSKVVPVDRTLASVLHDSIGEIGINVHDHTDSVGFVAAQTMPNVHELRFAVADAGIGLLATLGARGARDHRSAIEFALDGVSRFDARDRGNGVRTIARVVTELDGRVLLASGDAEVVESATSRTAVTCQHEIHGTVFEATIPLSSGRHSRSVA